MSLIDCLDHLANIAFDFFAARVSLVVESVTEILNGLVGFLVEFAIEEVANDIERGVVGQNAIFCRSAHVANCSLEQTSYLYYGYLLGREKVREFFWLIVRYAHFCILLCFCAMRTQFSLFLED